MGHAADRVRCDRRKSPRKRPIWLRIENVPKAKLAAQCGRPLSLSLGCRERNFWARRQTPKSANKIRHGPRRQRIRERAGPKIPAKRPYLTSYWKCPVCGDWMVSAADHPRLPRPIAPTGLGVSAFARPPVIGASNNPTNAAIEAPLTRRTVATPRCRTVDYPPRATAMPTSAPPTATIERPAAQGRSPL